MNGFKAWWLGLILIIIFVLLSNLTIIFKEYFFSQLKLNRNLISTLLWLLPIFASFLAVSFSQGGKIILGLSYIPILSLLGPIAHFLISQFGVTVDFGGVAGLRITFQIYLVLSVTTMGIGSVAGIIFRKVKSNGRSSSGEFR